MGEQRTEEFSDWGIDMITIAGKPKESYQAKR